MTALAEVLPSDLRSRNPNQQATVWSHWINNRDIEIRGRLAQGDEDSLVNFLLFGTSYTKRPRVTARDIAEIRADAEFSGGNKSEERAATILEGRVADLIRALAKVGRNERLLFARDFLASKGYRPNKGQDLVALKHYLLTIVIRNLKELAGYVKAVEAARLLGDPTEEFAERSRIYGTRGLSSDTSLLPNFALEESLKAIRNHGLLTAVGVRRVAIVGPGLDFTDKQEGYDFYPQQTIQPFAIVDTLLRLGLARLDALQITTFDLSPRVNQHLTLAQQRARRGHRYVLQLPRDPQAHWKAEAIGYWKQFGDQIGVATSPVKIPTNVGKLEIRAVSIRPEVVSLIKPMNLNIILQYLDLPVAERYDLIIATNIFVYYDTFEQCLALANVERMLRPGGIMLSNNALLELPFSLVRSVDYQTVVYSDRPDDGDHIVWYQRKAN